MANFSVKMDLTNTTRLMAEVEKVKKLKATVGVDAGAVESNGLKTSELAVYLEYGWVQKVTPKQTGFFWVHGLNVRNTLKLPPRPTFRYTATMNHEKWERVGAKVLASPDFVLNPMAVALKALNLACLTAQGDIQETITTNGHGTFAPRSPLTLAMYSGAYQSHTGGNASKRKNTSAANTSINANALVYKGDFLRSITYEIEGK